MSGINLRTSRVITRRGIEPSHRNEEAVAPGNRKVVKGVKVTIVTKAKTTKYPREVQNQSGSLINNNKNGDTLGKNRKGIARIISNFFMGLHLRNCEM